MINTSRFCYTNLFVRYNFLLLLGRNKDYLYFCVNLVYAPVVQWIEYRIPVPTI